MSYSPPYREELLHWVWEASRLDLNRLRTVDGRAITLYDPGTPNSSDGPDFLNAKLQIGRLTWFGDIEIHWQEQDWVRHGHHTDPNFNRVVLHVVWEVDASTTVYRNDQTEMAALVLKPFVEGPLRSFLDRCSRPESLPCAGHFSYISQAAFEEQLEKAHAAYFEQKVNDLAHFFDSSLPPSRAWKKMLATALSDGLGISHNREPMQALCNRIYSSLPDFTDKKNWVSFVVSKAGLAPENSNGSFSWKHKGIRPPNHPRHRVRQAAACLWFIHRLPFKNWLRGQPDALWEELNAQIICNPGLGKQRRDILFGTVWLPALFMLGNLFASEKIKSEAYAQWTRHRLILPKSLLKPFQSLDVAPSSYRHLLGTIYQLRSRCRPRRCEGCEVFKSIISP